LQDGHQINARVDLPKGEAERMSEMALDPNDKKLDLLDLL